MAAQHTRRGFVASGPNDAITEQLAGYVSERCEYTLWPNEARMVRSLLVSRRVDDAITFYFAVVGQRWDDERLELAGDDVEQSSFTQGSSESGIGFIG